MKTQRRNEFVDARIARKLKRLRRDRGGETQEEVRFAIDMNIARIESGRAFLGTQADPSDYLMFRSKSCSGE